MLDISQINVKEERWFMNAVLLHHGSFFGWKDLGKGCGTAAALRVCMCYNAAKGACSTQFNSTKFFFRIDVLYALPHNNTNTHWACFFFFHIKFHSPAVKLKKMGIRWEKKKILVMILVGMADFPRYGRTPLPVTTELCSFISTRLSSQRISGQIPVTTTTATSRVAVITKIF